MKLTKNKDKIINVRIDSDTYFSLSSYATACNYSVSQFTRCLIDNYLIKQKIKGATNDNK